MSNPTQAQFNPPVTNVDNSPVVPGEIAKYILAVGLAVVGSDGVSLVAPAVFPSVFSDLDVTPAPDGTVSIPLDSLGVLAPGNYFGIVTAVTAGGAQSAPSVAAPFAIAAPVVIPNPPTALKFV